MDADDWDRHLADLNSELVELRAELEGYKELRELRELRTVAHRALDLFTRWQSEHDPECCQFAEWDGLRDALESAGCFQLDFRA